MAVRDGEAVRRALQLYFIMGSGNCSRDPVQVLSDAIEGGVTMFQFREKGAAALSGEARADLARRLRELCRRSGVPFIVNDDVELALRIDADGVHVGQDDEAAAAVRSKIGSRLLGVSVCDGREAEAAAASGADYIGVGPLYATRTKEDAKPASGVGAITRIRASGLRIPIVGIGGINSDNACEVIGAGADGAAVISAIAHAESPFDAARQLRRTVAETLALSCIRKGEGRDGGA